MFSINFTLICTLFGAILVSFSSGDKVTPAPTPVFHATNRTRVPSVHYIIDAVETLKQSYDVYPDDSARAVVWAKLFQEKYPDNEWNVVIGYTASYVTAKYYVETSVDGGLPAADKKDKEKPASTKYYLIFTTLPNK